MTTCSPRISPIIRWFRSSCSIQPKSIRFFTTRTKRREKWTSKRKRTNKRISQISKERKKIQPTLIKKHINKKKKTKHKTRKETHKANIPNLTGNITWPNSITIIWKSSLSTRKKNNTTGKRKSHKLRLSHPNIKQITNRSITKNTKKINKRKFYDQKQLK